MDKKEIIIALKNIFKTTELLSKTAVNKYLSSPSELNNRQKLKIIETSIKAQSPYERINNLYEYLLIFINKDKENRLKILSNLIQLDPCFDVIAFFNFWDYLNDEKILNALISNKLFENKEDLFSKIKHKETFDLSIINFEANADNEFMIFSLIAQYCKKTNYNWDYVLSNKVCYLLCDWLLEETNILDSSYNINTHSTHEINNYVNLIENIGFKVFNLESFRTYYLSNQNTFYSNSYLNKFHYENILPVLNKPFLKTREYWLYYILVTTLKNTGLNTKPACELVSNYFNNRTDGKGFGTIRSRYFERKNIAQKNNYSLEKIIIDNFLNEEVNKSIENIDTFIKMNRN